jgi:large subunit ribosomal protein L22
MAAPTAVKDRPHTQAQVRYVRMSASKARAVLELIRGKSVGAADDALALSERDAARVIQKCLRSAVANAEHNDGLDPEELFVATCFADEGPTLRRFRPRARGRATRIRKRTCHITVIVARYSPDELDVRRESERTKGRGKARSSDASSRRRRVAKSRGEEAPTEDTVEETVDEVIEEPTVDETDTATEVTEDTDAEVDEVAEEAVEETVDEVAEEAVEETVDEVPADHESGGDTPQDAEALAAAHTKDELLEQAEAAGIEVAKSWTKPQIAEAIMASREDD